MIYENFAEIPDNTYKLVLMDPPWPMTDYSTASAAAHYPLMSQDQIMALDIRRIMQERAALFLWVPSTRIPMLPDLLEHWGLIYRNLAYIWVKTSKGGKPRIGVGVPPTFTKVYCEFVVAATTAPRGRVVPIKTMKQDSLVVTEHEDLAHLNEELAAITASMPVEAFAAPIGRHSEKPKVLYERIEELVGDKIQKIELFARGPIRDGWDAWGNEAGKPIDN